MPKPKLDEITTANGFVQGYRPRLRTRRIIGDEDHWPEVMNAAVDIWPEEGCEPFWADIRADLTFADVEELQQVKSDAEQMPIIAPWIVAWNATIRDEITGEYVPAPPPAEVGVEALRTQIPAVSSFIAGCIRFNLGTNLPKDRRRSGDTGGTPSGSD